jgi:hypothetical protein
MDKECRLVGATAKRVTRPKHVREIAAAHTGNATAIVDRMVAEVCLNRKMMEQSDGAGESEAIQRQILMGRDRAQRLVKPDVRVAAEYIDCRNVVLSGSDAYKEESCQSEVN